MLYTAGVITPGISVFGRTPAQALQYMTNGGDININAGGNIEGAVTNQFVTAWQWRTAGDATASPPLNIGGPAVSWTTNFSTFQQGVGALAGGNVTVNAGGDITNFSASIPSIGVQTASKNFPDSSVDVIGGGQLSVTAGGSILGGSYYVGLGSANLRAGEDIGVPAPVNGVSNASPLLGVGDASVAAIAGRNLQVSGIVDPMLLPPGQAEGIQPSYFTSFGKNSSATLTAIGGDLTLIDESGALQDTLNPSLLGGGSNRNQAVAFNIAPPVLNAYALSGNVDMSRTMVLSPAANGNLQVFADKSYNAGLVPGVASQFILADGDPALLPNITNPTQDLQGFADIAAALTVILADQHAATPVHAGDNSAPALVVARTGDIVENSALGGFWSAKPIRFVAAGDVVNLDLVAQNIKPSDVTSISAGGSILYPFARTQLGLLFPNLSQITVDGPGELQLEAGGTVNLGTALGITTRGNLVNPALASGGAGVSVEAGVAPGAAQYAAFITKYVLSSDDFDAELISFVTNTAGVPVTNAADAKNAFTSLSPQLQREFVEQTYFALLRDSGRTEAKLANGDFTEGFTAIQTLYPGGNPSTGQTNPYTGDIALYFSQIYTLQGGSISLLAPGGLINVGLAAAPSSFGVFKTPAQLGLVAQSTGDLNAYSFGDFEVNQSRVFAADGGNILVWSTGGDIDAGRGSKTAISAPPPTITVDQNGIPVVTFPSALTGSGIQALATSSGVNPGDVDLFAPHGVVNANDAGIVAGNLTIAATAVLGTSNISVSGTSVGVPVTVTGLGAGAAAAAGSAGSAANAAQDAATQNASQAPVTSAGESALGWLDVFVTGLGEEQCKPDDVDCIKRQKQH